MGPRVRNFLLLLCALLVGVETGCGEDEAPDGSRQHPLLSGWAESVGGERVVEGKWPVRIRRLRDGAEMVLVDGKAAVLSERDAFDIDLAVPATKSVDLGEYYIDACEITNGMFEKFVAATLYVTTQERRRFLLQTLNRDGEWKDLYTLTWRDPWPLLEPDAGWSGRPVVTMDWGDVLAYAEWAGASPVTEAQWEHVARQGANSGVYAWREGETARVLGENFRGNEFYRFFHKGAVEKYEDGYVLLARVRETRPNAMGVWDILGNAVELCQPGDRELSALELRGLDICASRGHGWYGIYAVSSAGARVRGETTVLTGFRLARSIQSLLKR